MSPDAVVVGSGPAGVAAASALLRRRRKVLMLDGGVRLEPQRQAVIEQMARLDPASWTPEQLATIKEGMEPGAEGIPLKRLFGSDFAFQEISRFAEITTEQSDLKMSLALGGLSNVWGAGAFPFCADDISDWPLRIDDLAPFYRECLEEMELSAASDALASDYPLYTARYGTLRPSNQAAAFLADLEKKKHELERAGICFGVSRLAVKATRNDEPKGCVYCGLCLYGCPYGFIYNSADVVRSLLRHGGFSYQPDVVVERLEESGNDITVHARRRPDGSPLKFTAPQVFLACGAIPTTAILLESMAAWDQPLEMKDSQYFLLPALRFKSTAGVETERLHTLAQVFVELRDPAVSAKGIHLSVYTYNDLLLAALRKQAGPLAGIWPGLPHALARRLLVFGGYLHSNESPSIQFTLSRSAAGTRRILLRGSERVATRKTFRRLLRKLERNTLRFKAIPLIPLARRGLPGRGFHFGGTFPMAHDPARFQSDLAGRPHGFTRVHVVDATVFPSIPAPNLTLSVMANARRIAELACRA